MQYRMTLDRVTVSVLTLLVGTLGAWIGWMFSAPVFMLMGPAVAVCLASLAGFRSGVDDRLRNVCFVILGLAVGAGFDADALATMLRWPLAFAMMALTMWAILRVSCALLVRFFRYSDRAALLAAAPGHLSFVVAIASDMGADLARISVAQSVRLLSLTLVVPFAAIALGVEVSTNIAPQGSQMAYGPLAVLAVLGGALGLVFARLSVPAPLLMGALVVSAIGHLTETAPGVLPEWLILPAYLVLGSLIGARFSGISLMDLRRGLAAGLVVTAVATLFAALAAIPVAWALGMPLAHVLTAFAPGGLETMIAMAAVLGVVPGFVAACHIARLVVLTFLLPVMLAARQQREPAE